jgi:transcriptional regulator with XRE-family HTH domain
LTVRPTTDILGFMSTGRPTSLRAARAARGWSQSEAARALAELASTRGVAVASAASLKTQLSRWENGHATPETPYRNLLGELYAGAGVDLAPADPASVGPADPAERLRARLAAAAAVDGDVIALWRTQLTTARRLDDRLGAAGAGDAVRVLVEQLEAVLPHIPDPVRRRPVAVLLARACLLAGTQALDTGDADAAVARFARAAETARAAGSVSLAVEAAVGHAEVLVEVGAPGDALAVLKNALDPVPALRAGEIPDPAGRLLGATVALARAAAGDADGAYRALTHEPLIERVTAAVDVAHAPGGLAVELAEPSPDLRHRRGRTLALLHDDAAIDHLADSLKDGSPSARDRAATHADLALALTAAGRGDEAAPHTRAARDLATRIGSRRVLRRLDGHGLSAGSAVSSSASAAR